MKWRYRCSSARLCKFLARYGRKVSVRYFFRESTKTAEAHLIASRIRKPRRTRLTLLQILQFAALTLQRIFHTAAAAAMRADVPVLLPSQTRGAQAAPARPSVRFTCARRFYRALFISILLFLENAITRCAAPRRFCNHGAYIFILFTVSRIVIRTECLRSRVLPPETNLRSSWDSLVLTTILAHVLTFNINYYLSVIKEEIIISNI